MKNITEYFEGGLVDYFISKKGTFKRIFTEESPSVYTLKWEGWV